MSAKRTLLTAATSYVAMGSGMFTSLLLLRLATQNLREDEMGLWAFCFGTVGYFLLMDFGVTNSLGRLFADAVTKQDHREMSGWLYLTTGILTLQGALILSVGLLTRDAILAWFKIPAELLPEARSLWTWLILIQATTMPLRALPGFRYAQNRVYHNHIFGMVSSWLNVGLFWWWLSRGSGVMSYAYASAVSTWVIQAGYIFSVFTGSGRLRLHAVKPHFEKLPELFKYSSALFIESLATQMSGATQTMILTRLLGLDAVAVLGVTSRLPNVFAQLVWKPFDAFVPRWMLAYCANDFNRARLEMIVILRITVLLVFCTLGFVTAANQSFVEWWTRPQFFGGTLLTILLGLTFVTGTLQHCLAFAFHLSKRMAAFTGVLLAGFVSEALVGIFLVPHLGILGIPMATLLVSLTFVLWFHIISGGRTLGIPVLSSLRLEILIGVALVTVCIVLAWASQFLELTGFPRLLFLSVAASVCLLPAVARIIFLLQKWDAARRVGLPSTS